MALKMALSATVALMLELVQFIPVLLTVVIKVKWWLYGCERVYQMEAGVERYQSVNVVSIDCEHKYIVI